MNDHKVSAVKSACMTRVLVGLVALVGPMALVGVVALVGPVAPVGLARAQGRAALPRRAAPPKFDRAETQGVFFDNLFGQQGPLVGTRPASATAPSVVRSPAGVAAPTTTAGGASSAPAAGGGEASGWAAVISPQTVEDEIKALNLQVAESVTTPTMFAGAGHKQAQKQFTLLAMLFGIIGEYGGDIRWKDAAPTLRDRFARAAANTKAGGNIQVYNEAKLRRDELDSVVRGSQVEADAAEPKAAWESVAARSPLMRVLEDRSAKYLQQATASQAEFAKEPEKILHEAELVAAMSEVLLKEGMNDADDAEYRGFAERMKKAALDTVAAVKLSNADQGRMAVGEMTQACSACHELYR